MFNMTNMTLESCPQVVYTSWPSVSSCLPNSTVSSVLETEVERLKSERAGCPFIWSGFWSSSPRKTAGQSWAVTCGKGWSSSDLQLLAKRLFPCQLNLFLQPPITTQLHSHQKSFLDIWQDVQEVSSYSFPQSTATPAAN